MKVLIYSNPSLADCNLPLVKAFQAKGIDVTYLIELSSSGAQGTILDIKRGHNVNGIEHSSSYPELSVFADYLCLDNVYVRNYYRKHKIPLIDSIALSIKCFSFLKKNGFDIIQRDQAFFRSDIIMYFFRRKMVRIVHDPFFHSGSRLGGVTKLFYDFGFKIVSRFVLLNNTQYEDFCRVYDKKRKDVLINTLGVYDCYNLFKKDSIVAKTKRLNVLFFGRIAKYKGLEFLCEAMKIVHESLPDATVTIAGNGTFCFDIKPYEQLSYFRFINRFIPVRELSKLLDQCTVVVCPYTDSTQSGVAMTAFSMAKPIVASRVGGLAEQIDDGKSGILVPPKSTKELANAILRLLQDKELRDSMSEFIISEYRYGKRSWEVIADRYIRFYSEMVK